MSGPPPAVAAVRVAVRTALTDVPRGACVLVACSGGADSLALAAGVATEARAAGVRAGAVVVDHGLLDGSARVAQDAADACRALGLAPVRVERVVVGAAGGPEGAARTARYAALARVADDEGAVAVLLGHTLDDQAETVLLALARGSGERALAGMRPVRGVWLRPLLGVRRAQTEAACAAQGLTPWHDPTNGRDDPADGRDDPAEGPADAPPAALPVRSRVRREVLPVLEDVLGPGVAQALARTADALADAADALDAAAADLLADAAVPDDPDGPRAPDGPHDGDVVLHVDVLAAAPAGVRRRALHDAAVRAGCPPGALARVHVLAVDALLTRWRGQGPVHLPGGRAATRACGRLYLGRPRTPADGGTPAPAPGGPGHDHDDDHDDRE